MTAGPVLGPAQPRDAALVDATPDPVDVDPDPRPLSGTGGAQALLPEHRFATTDVHRVEASTDVDDTAEQRALEKVGFRRGGVLRRAQLRGGQRRDLVLCSLVRGELRG